MQPHDNADTPQLKQCSRCKLLLPATLFYFRANKLARGGFHSACKKCLGSEYKAPRAEFPFPPKEGFKICLKCCQEKPATDEFFYRKAKGGDFINVCKPCRCVQAINYYEQNKEEIKPRIYEWQRQNRERVRQYHAAYRAKNPLEKKNRYWSDPERYRRESREWVKRNPQWAKCYREEFGALNRKKQRENRRVYLVRRRARVRGLSDSFGPIDWQHALDFFGGVCAVCGRPPGLWHTLAMDHWIPLSDPKCPGTIPANIIPLCNGSDGCNQSKNNKEPAAWLTSKFGKRKAQKVLSRINIYFETIHNR